MDELNADYDKVREQHANKKVIPLWPLAKARANKTPVGLELPTMPPAPNSLGRRVFKNFDLGELAKYIDWGPFFQTWDLAGSVSRHPERRGRGRRGARVCYADGKRMLKRLIEGRWLTASGVIGLLPANSVNDDDIELLHRRHPQPKWRIDLVRPAPAGRKTGPVDGVTRPSRCLADFVAPKRKRGIADYAGMFAVTAGLGDREEGKGLHRRRWTTTPPSCSRALADRLAEAFAECLAPPRAH